jgi:hypothetical protein
VMSFQRWADAPLRLFCEVIARFFNARVTDRPSPEHWRDVMRRISI